MLKAFRNKNVTKMVLWGILILILPAFVLWGTGNTGRSRDKGPTFAGTIEGKKVTFDEFAKSLTSIRCKIILNYFGQPQLLDSLLDNQAFIGKLAWGRLLMLKEAGKEGIKVPDQEVISYIRSHPIFLRNGQFDDKIYSYILRRNIGLEPRTFEEIIRQNIEIKRLNDILTKDVRVSEEDAVGSYMKENGKFRLSYAFFPSDSFIDKAAVSDEAAKAYYDSHLGQFMLPAEAGGNKSAGAAPAKFDDVRDSIKSYLAGNEARVRALEKAREESAKLKDIMKNESLGFEQAAAKLGLKTSESGAFSGSEYIEGVGEASKIIEEAAVLGSGEVSRPVDTGKGAIIFRVMDTQGFDREKFEKDKASYSSKALEAKKARRLEEILRDLDSRNKANIDFADYEKYYR